jgi:predicted  nucleic acid-binding Zn-ribbon protein
MNIALLNLKKLQDVDDLARAERKAVAEGRTLLAAARAKLKNGEDRLAEIRRLQGNEEARHRDLEGELKTLSVKKKSNEDRLLIFKNNTEYTALIKEADFLAKRVDEIENEALAILERLEKRATAIGATELALAQTRDAVTGQAADFKAAEAVSQNCLADLAAQRVALTGAIEPNLIKRYEEIAGNKGGLAVAAAQNGLCLACRMGFPPQIYNELQQNEKISVCPNCGRFLYWPGHHDFQPQEEPKP